MLGGLKEKAVNAALARLEDDVRERVTEKIALFSNLKPSDVNDDEKYAALVVAPLWSLIQLQSGGALAAAPKLVDFDLRERFQKGLFRVRDELIEVDGDDVRLDPQFRDKVGPTLVAALKDQ